MTDSHDVTPLTATQRRIWFLSQADPSSAAYNLTVTLRVRGGLEPERLGAALARVVERHDALRTVVETNAGLPRQRLVPSRTVPLEQREASPTDLDDVLREMARTPFAIDQEVLRTTLLRLGDEDHVLVVSLHHLVADGWSARVFVRDLEIAYRDGGIDRRPPRHTPLTHAVAEREAESDAEAEQFWMDHLGGAPMESTVPGSATPLHADRSVGARVPFALSPDAWARVKALTMATGARPFDFLVAALQLLVARLAAQDDVTIALPMANRAPEARDAVGMFVNTLPLRAVLDEDTTFRQHLLQVHCDVETARRHQHVPFDRVLELLGVVREADGQSLCQVMLNYLGTPMHAPAMYGLETQLVGPVDTGTAQYDLALHVETPRGEGVRGWFEFRRSCYDDAWVRLIGDRLVALVESVVAEPDRPVRSLNLLPASERSILTSFAHVTGPEPGPYRLPDLIVEQARRTPDSVAVRADETELTYSQLLERARGLAVELTGRGVGPDVVVGVCGQRSAELVVALLGILLADGAYLPLDPDHPVRRLTEILDEAHPQVVLADNAYVGHVRKAAPAGVPVLSLTGTGRLASAPGTGRAPGPDDLAYVIYTSGSTGRPKGVAVPHRGIVNRLLWMQSRYRLEAHDVVLQKTPATFDVSVWEFFWPLMYGARLVMARPDGHRDPAYLTEVIRQESVTTLHFVPSMLTAFVDEPTVALCTSLRRVICSGEALPTPLVARFRAVHGAAVHNLYGPTEASVDVTHWTCRDNEPGAIVPIGRPVSNTTILVLDADGDLAPIGTPGELYIGGVQLARGYLGRPELTAERFVDGPHGRLYRSGDLARWMPEGHLEFLGRVDNQVKLRGFRIELGEIEAALTDQQAVTESAVVVRDDLGPAPHLVGYVTTSSPLDPDTLRDGLADRLPVYMVPTHFVVLAAFPTTSSGKLDRAALPRPEVRRDRGGSGGPLSDAAQRLRVVWAKVLDVDPGLIAADTNFFEHGGDSILSIRVRALLREQGLDLAVSDLFRAQTLASAAAQLTPFTGEPEMVVELDRHDALPDGVADAYPLSALQAGMIFHSEYGNDDAVYQVSFLLHLRMPVEVGALQSSVDELVAQHDILRTRFDLGAAHGAVQYVQSSAQLPVTFVDLRDKTANEQRRLADQMFAEEQETSFDLSSAPLLRLTVLRQADDVIDLLMSFHDSIFDGWSAATFLTELFATYLNRLAGRNSSPVEPYVRYRDFLVAERTALADDAVEEFWTRRLAGAHFLRLPRRAPGDAVNRSVDLPVAVPGDLAVRLREFGARFSLPHKTVLLGAYLATLARHTGHSDVLTGLVSGGRPELPGAERVLGQFLNTVPFRVEVTGTWTAFLRNVLEEESALLPHRRFPAIELQRRHKGKALFETAFNYVHFHVYHELADRPELVYLGGEFTDPFHFPLTVNARVHPLTGDLTVVANHATSEITASQALAFAHDMVDALRVITVTPDRRCEDWTGARGDLVPDGYPLVAGRRSAAPSDRRAAGIERGPTRIEADLLTIMSAVLGVGSVGVHDNFFDLGGDSILSIQICAQARQRGVDIRPKDVFDHPTALLLAEYVEQRGSMIDGYAATVGPLPASPRQAALLAGEDQRDWDNVSLVVTLREPLDAGRLGEAVDIVLHRHEALRTAIERRPDGTWWQEVREPTPAAEGVRVHFPDGSDIEAWQASLHQSLTLSAGQVFRVGLAPDRLVLIAHHAVADAASMQIVLGELVGAYLGHPPYLPAVPVWALSGPDRTTVDAPPGADGRVLDWKSGSAHADERAVERDLDPDTTTALLDRARTARLNPLHLLVAATGAALVRANWRPRIVVDVMSGGRDRSDLTDAVGCLATPVPVPVPTDTDTLTAARALRQVIPIGGDEPTVTPGPALGTDRPDVLVNYLGRVDPQLPEPLVAVTPDIERDRAPNRPRMHALEVVAFVTGGKLRLRAAHAASEADVARVEDLVDAVVAEVGVVARSTREAPPPTADDFPLAGLSQTSVDSLMRQLGGGA